MAGGNYFPHNYYQQNNQWQGYGAPQQGWSDQSQYEPSAQSFSPTAGLHVMDMSGSSASHYMTQTDTAPAPYHGAYGGYNSYNVPQPEYAPAQPVAPRYDQPQALAPINTNTGSFASSYSPSPSTSGAMQLFSPQQGNQELSQNQKFNEALYRVFEHDPNINEPETLQAVQAANKLIPGMHELNGFLSQNGLRWNEGQKFKFAIHAIMFKPHFVCENSEQTAKKMKKPCPNMLCRTLDGGTIDSPNDEALQQIVFIGKAFGFFNNEGAAFNTVAPGVTDNIVDPLMSSVPGEAAVIPSRLAMKKGDKPDGYGLALGVNQAGSHHYAGQYNMANQFKRPVHLFVFTDGVSRKSRDNFSDEIGLFLSQNDKNRVTLCPNQDDNLNILKFSSSGGSQINFLNSMVSQFDGKLDSVDDFRSESEKAPQHMQNASDYFYRLAMGVHDPAVIRDAQLFGANQLNTKTQAMIKLGKEAVPIIAKIGIKVALTI